MLVRRSTDFGATALSLQILDLNRQNAPQARHQAVDEHRLAQRLKQIEYGKNTIGYQNYTKIVPKYVLVRFAL